MRLDEFLLARIAEDAANARRVGSVAHPLSQDAYFRVLAECEAKRQIVEAHGAVHTCVEADRDEADAGPSEPCLTLRLLALPYADHEDFREEWKP